MIPVIFGRLRHLLFALGLAAICQPSAWAVTYRTIALTGWPVPGKAQGATFSYFASSGPVLNELGQTAFVGSYTGTEQGAAVWSEGGGSLHVSIGAGAQLGSAEVIKYLVAGPVLLSDSGQVALFASLVDISNPYSDVESIWKESNGVAVLVSKAGSAVPDAPQETYFDDLRGVSAIDGNGNVGFLAGLKGPTIDSSNRFGIWAERQGSLKQIAREGAHAPGTNAGVSFFFWDRVFPYPVFNRDGESAFRANVTGPGTDPSNDRGIWSEGGGPLHLVARSGATAPATEAGVVFRGFGNPKINDVGQVAFGAGLSGPTVNFTNDVGLWAGTATDLRLVARYGSPAPDLDFGVTFTHFNYDAPMLNELGQVAFGASVKGVHSARDSGIWVERAGALRLLCREGDPAPGTGDDVTFAGLGEAAPSINSHGWIAFGAELEGPGINSKNDYCIWAEGPDGLALIARDGSLFEAAPGDLRTISEVSYGGFNDRGQLAFTATFTDGTRGVFVASLAQIPEPSTFPMALMTVGFSSFRRRKRGLLRG